MRPVSLLPTFLILLTPPALAEPPHGGAAPGDTAVEFPAREQVSYREFIDRMRAIADELARTPAVRQAHAALLAEHNLSAEQLPVQSFSRVRLVFEATRDGGLWGIRWTITDQMPWSDRIWKQWRALDFGVNPERSASLPDDAVTAYAECDELSALFAMLARDLGVAGFVGLHWPTWNHTVAVWQLEVESRHERIAVPTSQFFIGRDATLGTHEMPTHRVVFPYPRQDLKANTQLPAPLVRFLLERLQRFGAESTEALQARRNTLGGS